MNTAAIDVARSSNQEIICRYIEAYLFKHWPGVKFKADVLYSPMEICVYVRVLVPTPSGQYVYVVQKNREEDIDALKNFKLEDETIAQIMLLMG